MPAGPITAATRALSSAGTSARQLEQVAIPRWFGRADAIANATELRSLAVRDAEHAARLLDELPGAAPATIAQVRAAARSVSESPLRSDDLRTRGMRLGQAIISAREAHASAAFADPHLAASWIDELVERDPQTMGPADWQQLRRLLDAAPAERGIRQLDGLGSFGEVIDRQARYPAFSPIDRDDVRRYFAAWRHGEEPPQVRASAASNLLERDPVELGREDWRALVTLVDADPVEAALPRTRKLPLLPPIRDVLDRRARAFPRPGPPDLAASADHADLRQYRAAWRLEGSTLAQRESSLRDLLAREPEELASDDWATLHQLLVDPELPRGPRQLQGLIRFDEIAAKSVERPMGAAGNDNTRRYFEAWRLASAPEATRAERARELVARDPHELTPGDWEQLQTILGSDPAGKVLPGPREIEGMRPAAELVAASAQPSAIAGSMAWQMNRYYSSWRRALDPTYEAKVTEALSAVAGGSTDPHLRSVVAGEGHRLEELVAGRPPQEQSAIALAMLERPDISASRGVEGTLELLRGGLAKAPSGDAEVDALRGQTLELVDRNLARLRGEALPDGAIRGYGRHPDYAEIGSIRENVTLLDQLDRATVEAASAADTLAW